MNAKNRRRNGWGAIVCVSTGLLLVGCVTSVDPKFDKAPAEKNATIEADPFAAKAAEPGAKAWNVVYENDFSGYAVGEEPEDLFILDGSFSVQEVEGGKVLSLASAPVGEFGILFGPRVKGKPVELRCRVFSTRKGRRMPAFAAGLGGVSGYRLRLNAAARNLQLLRGEETLASVPRAWQAGAWTNLRLRAEPKGEAGVVVSAKVWPGDSAEPADWILVHEDSEPFAGGKCSLFGLPYADTEILFDEIKVFASGSPE